MNDSKSANEVKPQNAPGDSRPGAIYDVLVEDHSLAHGAFRLWHLLHGMAGKKGCCWPGQRLIQKRLGCSTGSIGTWTDQLTKAGYVRLEEFDLIKHPFCGGKNDGFVYFLSPTVANSGNGSVAESGNGSVAKTGNATVASLSLKVLPEVETHTVANNGNEIDLKELTEGNEREKAAFHSPFAETPKDKGQEIQAFHALYQKLTGYSEIALDMARERQWFEWLQYGITHQHPFTHEDFKLVIKLIHEGISNATSNQGAYRRNRGALKLDNLIGDPGRFEQDLAEARTHFGKRTKPATAPKQAVLEPIDPQAKAIADKVSQEIARRDGEISTAIERIKDDDANWNFSHGVRRCLTRQADLEVKTLETKRAALKR